VKAWSRKRTGCHSKQGRGQGRKVKKERNSIFSKNKEEEIGSLPWGKGEKVFEKKEEDCAVTSSVAEKGEDHPFIHQKAGKMQKSSVCSGKKEKRGRSPSRKKKRCPYRQRRGHIDGDQRLPSEEGKDERMRNGKKKVQEREKGRSATKLFRGGGHARTCANREEKCGGRVLKVEGREGEPGKKGRKNAAGSPLNRLPETSEGRAERGERRGG